MTKGWKREPARHSLAARGLRTSHTTRHSPMKSAKHGPRASTVKKWLEEWFENYRSTQAKNDDDETSKYSIWNKNSFMLVIATGKSDSGLDYVDVRTDGTAYDLFYNPGMGDLPHLGYKAQEKLHRDLGHKFPGLYFEHEGGGVLRAYLWNYHGDLAEVQAAEANEAMEERITKYEKDYTGEYTRGH